MIQTISHDCFLHDSKGPGSCQQCHIEFQTLNGELRPALTTTIKSSVNPKEKFGAQKVQLHLVPPASMIYQALAMEDGASKYGPYNFRVTDIKATPYISAAMRHLMSFLDGEDNAQDSKKPHLAHALASIGIIVDAIENNRLIDDRPSKGNAANLIERLKNEKTKQ